MSRSMCVYKHIHTYHVSLPLSLSLSLSLSVRARAWVYEIRSDHTAAIRPHSCHLTTHNHTAAI